MLGAIGSWLQAQITYGHYNIHITLCFWSLVTFLSCSVTDINWGEHESAFSWKRVGCPRLTARANLWSLMDSLITQYWKEFEEDIFWMSTELFRKWSKLKIMKNENLEFWSKIFRNLSSEVVNISFQVLRQMV